MAERKVWVIERRFTECEWEPFYVEPQSEGAANHKAKVWNDSPGAMANYRVVTYEPKESR